MEQNELIGKMRARVAQCRQLARSINDARAAGILRAMAEEGEADIKRLLDAKEQERPEQSIR